MMTAELPTRTGLPLADALNDVADARAKAETNRPAWLRERTQKAYALYGSLGMPTRRHEDWRHIDLGMLTAHPIGNTLQESAQTLSYEELAPFDYPETAASRLVFLNGRYQPAWSSIDNLKDTVLVSELSEALAGRADLNLEAYFGRHVETEADVFAALNLAVFDQGAVIVVPAGVAAVTPIHLLFLSRADEAVGVQSHPRILVTAGEHAKVTLVAQYATIGNETASNLTNAVTEIHVADHAEVTLTHAQLDGGRSRALFATRATLGTQSHFNLTAATLGGELSRHNLHVTLAGEEGQCCLNGLSVLTETSQAYDLVTLDHQQPHCTTEQLYKGILDGHAKSGFDGTIVIRRGAQKTDAAQLSRNLLLSDDARVTTRPQLRIDADDVKCAHGATVGQLSEAELFYLASRGLSAQRARSILTFGFAEDVLMRIPVPGLRKHLIDRVHDLLHNIGEDVD